MARDAARNIDNDVEGAPQRDAVASPRSPNPVDAHVGRRLKQQRLYMGLSQAELADSVGLTFQQIQKYEHGTNRISASCLFTLAHVLHTRVGWFFEEYGSSPDESNSDTTQEEDYFDSRDAYDLLRAYYSMSPSLQQTFFAMARELGKEQSQGGAPDPTSEGIATDATADPCIMV